MSQLTSLRERKRAETWQALHHAALTAALEQGFETVSVDAVAAAAGVSPRTFFNYFPCRDDAVLGLREPTVTPEASVAFDARGDLLEQAGHLLMSVTHSIQSGSAAEAREIRQLITDIPQLFGRRFQYFLRAEELTLATIAERLHSAGRWAEKSRETFDESVRMLVLTASAAVRHILQDRTLADRREQRQALPHRIELVRSVTETA